MFYYVFFILEQNQGVWLEPDSIITSKQDQRPGWYHSWPMHGSERQKPPMDSWTYKCSSRPAHNGIANI